MALIALDFHAGKKAADAGDQVALVARSLHTEQIVLKQAFEDPTTPWKLLEDIGRRKRDMHEEGEHAQRRGERQQP